MSSATTTRTPEEILAELEALVANQELTILKLSESVTAEIAHLQPQRPSQSQSQSESQSQLQRTSDVSTASLDVTTPASLEADLTHYRELFAKLRFSYVEQVTKEKFIRAIVGDPPLIVSAQDNADLEARNRAAKTTLKALKTDVGGVAADLDARARDLASRYERVAADKAKLAELPAKIAALEADVAGLAAARAERTDPNPELNLPLARTRERVAAKEGRRDELERQLEQLRSQVPRKGRELERLRAEMQPLETRRANSVAAAREARRRKEAAGGDGEDDLEERGRWYRSTETALKDMLEIGT
ncbi:hypothetical protein F5Y14DRAFT_192590 [Nemania sp. NC0429]|nr:hypothetical protein F5Y14DRAFT_192590 [Nemania sp. NC0429]